MADADADADMVRHRPGPAHAVPAAPAPTVRWAPLAVITTAHLMAILDATVMFVALPSAQHALGLPVAARQWVVTGYTLAFAAVLLPGGRLADRLGARRTLLAGVLGFAAASAVGGAAVDGAMLITARAVQGAFAAVLVSSTKSLLVMAYPGDRARARAMGVFAATLTAGAAAGLILGGLLTSGPGWRWCLYLNVLPCLAVLAAAPRVLSPVAGRPEVRLDMASALLAAAGMVALIYGLAEVPSLGWGSAAVAGSLIAAAVLLGAFIARQAGQAGALLPLRVLRDRNRAGALVALVVNSLSTFGLMLVLTFQLQSLMRYSPLRTGLALLPFAVAAAVAAALIAPRLLVRVAPRWLILAGLLLSAAGLLPLAWLSPGRHYLPLILTATVLEGLGTGLGGPPALSTALRGVLPADTGAASAASSAASQLGSSAGAALLNTIAATAAAGYLAAHGAAGTTAATVHGYAVAAVCGAVVILIAAVPAGLMINAAAPPRRHRAGAGDLSGASGVARR